MKKRRKILKRISAIILVLCMIMVTSGLETIPVSAQAVSEETTAAQDAVNESIAASDEAVSAVEEELEKALDEAQTQADEAVAASEEAAAAAEESAEEAAAAAEEAVKEAVEEAQAAANEAAASSVSTSVTYTCENGIELYFDTSTGTITGADLNGETSLEIPDTIEDVAVTQIGSSAFYTTSLISVTIPDTVTYIGDNAFSFSDSLVSIDLGTGVQSFGDYVFFDSSALEEITLPEGLVTLGKGSFYGCASLKSIEVPSGVTELESGVFSYCTSLESCTLSEGLIYIDEFSFSGCESLVSIDLPDSLTSIGADAFLWCYDLAEISFGNQLEMIDAWAFHSCSSLACVVLPDSLNTLGEGVFYNTGLVEIDLGEGLQTIGDYAFQDSALTSIVLPDSLISIGASVFYSTSLSEVEFGEGLQTIGDYAFQGCPLTSIVLPDSLISIGVFVFYSTSLSEVEFGEGLQTIGDYAFHSCGLTSIVLPDSLITIGENAFAFLESLVTLDLGNGVSEIDPCAFYGCTSLTEVVIPGSLTTWGNGIFGSCTALEQVTFSEGLTTIGEYTFEGTAIKEVTLPDSMTSLGEGAFYNATLLEHIEIPESVTQIPANCFKNCYALESIELPSTITLIDDWAFLCCNSLASVELPGFLTEIGENAFGSCYSITEITIPDSVTTIETCAFWGTSLNTVTIPAGVETVGDYAFDGCYSLTSIYFLGTDTQIGDAIVPLSMTESLTFYGYAGSTAETYASEYGYTFVSLDSLYRTLSAVVCLPDGTQVTEGFSVVWYDADGNTVSTDTELEDVSASDTYTLQVVPDSSLLEDYFTPDSVSITPDDDAQCTVTLEARTQITVTGTVTDPDGAAISDADITVTRAATGTVVTAQTAQDGSFSFTVMADQISVKYAADGYYSKSTVYDLSDVTDSDYDLGTKTLTATITDRITLNITLRQAAAEGDEASTLTVSDVGNYDLAITGEDGEDITGFEVQGLNLIFEPDMVTAGETVTVTISDPTGSYLSASAEVTLDESSVGSADLTLIQKGSFTIDELSGNSARILLFDANDTLVLSETAQVLTSYGPLDAGTYTAVLIEKSNYLTSIPSQAWLDAIGLTAGEDYLSVEVTIEDGVITTVSSVTVPELDEDTLTYATDSASLTISGSSSITQGAYFILCAEYEMSDSASADAESVQIVLPEGVDVTSSRAALVNNSSVTYTYDDSSRTATIPVSGADAAVVYLYCQAGTTTGTYAISAALCLSDTNLQAIGSTCVTVEDSSISVPSTTSQTTIVVSGVTVPNSTVSIYVDGTLVAETTSNSAGSWSTQVDLTAAGKVYSYSYHTVYAKITDSDGEQIAVTDSELVTYDARTATLEQITMYNVGDYGEQETVIDYTSDDTTVPYYLYSSAYPTFTFDVKFSDDEYLSEVYVVTYNSYGDETYISTTYNEETGTWVGTYDFEHSWEMPATICAEWTYIDELEAFTDEEWEADLEEELTEEYTELYETVSAYLEENYSLENLQYEEDGSYLSADVTYTGDESDSEAGGSFEISVDTISADDISSLSSDGYTSSEVESTDDTYVIWEKDTVADLTETIIMVDEESGQRITIAITADSGSVLADSSSISTLDFVDNLYSTTFAQLRSLAIIAGAVLITGVIAGATGGLGLALSVAMFGKIVACLDTAAEFACSMNDIKASSQQYYKQLSGNESKLYSELSEAASLLSAKCKDGTTSKLSTEDLSNFTSQLNAMQDDIYTYSQEAQRLISVAQAEAIARATAIASASAIFSFKVMAATTAVNTIASICNVCYEAAGSYISSEYKTQLSALKNLKKQIKAAYSCEKKPDTDDKSQQAKLKGCPDPSGYVYEAVPSNRLEGVTATIYYEDEDGEAVAWDASDYDQVSPQVTGTDGVYQWYVPEGNWKVTFTRDGYEDTDTSGVAVSLGYEDGWLTVSPPQLDINVAMVSTASPEVSAVAAYADQVIVTFSQYMNIESVQESVTLTLSDGTEASVTITALDAEYDAAEENQYATRFAITPAETISGSCSVKIAEGVKNYAGTAMGVSYDSGTLSVAQTPTSINMREEVSVVMGEELSINLTLLPGVADTELTIESNSSSVAQVLTESVTTDDDGNAVVTIKGVRTGSCLLTVEEPLSGLTHTVTVYVTAETPDEVSAVTASLSDGTTVTDGMTITSGSTITLSTETEDTQIKYTLDGTCPCRNSALDYTDGIELSYDEETEVELRAAALVDGVFSEISVWNLTVVNIVDLSADGSAALSATSYTYDGTAKTPSVTVTAVRNGETVTLTKDTDYTVSYSANTNAGTATVTITGTGYYTGTITKSFTIRAASLGSAKLSASTYTYDGSTKTPTVTVYDSAGTALSSSCYSVTWASGRKSAGTYAVTITGKGNYTGTITKSFTIKAASLGSAKLSSSSYTYNGKAKKPSVTVYDAAGTKLSSSCYKVTWASGRKAIGSYTVTITGKGNYTGTIKKTFKIVPGKVTLKSATKSTSKKKLTVSWKKVSGSVSKYQIRYRVKGTSKWKTVTVSKSTLKKTISGLKSGKKYQVQVRAYKTVKGTKYYGSWSKTKTVSVK